MKTILTSAFLSAALFIGQPALAAGTGKLERVKVHAKSLEGNLEGDSPDRDVSIYLPPSYQTEKARRYPVLYMLHGFTDSDDKWMGPTKHWINLPSILDKVAGNPGIREMIIVMPNAFTRYQGSMYSNSVTTGNWEDFVVQELVAYVDAHYRTIPRAESRGLAGHSMGGYGAMRIGMKHPDIFSSIYLLSGCCMTPPNPQRNAGMMEHAAAIKNFADIEKADFLAKAMEAGAAAWSPNPQNPPLYLDLPWRDGQWRPEIASKWAANAPLAMIDQYIANLKRLRAIAFDAGANDDGITETTRELDAVMTRYGIAHTFEIYDGDHVNHIADRIETKLIPFFSKNLAF